MHVRDTLNILSTLTVARVFNLGKLHLSYYVSKIFKTNYHRGLPTSLSIEPTTACNLGCPECPSGLKKFTRATGNLKLELLQKIIDEQSINLAYITFYFQGEPFINPSFLDMVSYVSRKNIYTATSTNAHFITPDIATKTVLSGLSRLIISIDGTTQEVYEQYRREGDLTKVIEGAKNMVAAKKKLKSSTPHLIFQFLVVKPNEHQLDSVHQLAKEIGIDEVRFKTAQVYDYKQGNPLIPENDKYSRYKKQKDGTYTIKNYLENHCWRMWSSSVITWDGKVVPCCFDKDASHQLGDVQVESFKHVWKSKPYEAFRSAVLKSRSQIDICANCSEGTKVWA